jgi:2-(1,2-epoxy-1,2-dihydrophenyl)acetyl-CoA isomerase
VGIYEDLVRAGSGTERSYVDVERSGASAWVTLNEPARLNPLSAPLVIQLRAALSELTADPTVRSIVLTGAGEAFSAGGDLKMMGLAEGRLADAEGSTDIWRWIRNEFGGVLRLIVKSDTAFICALNGAAAGVALAWVLNCYVVVASENAVLVPAFGRIGLLPEVGTSWVLTRTLGYQGAFTFIAGGMHLSAADAMEAGLLSEVVAADELRAAADRWCQRIAALPEHVVPMAKPLLRAASDSSWDASVAMEEFAEPNCFTTGDFQAAVRAMAPEPMQSVGDTTA